MFGDLKVTTSHLFIQRNTINRMNDIINREAVVMLIRGWDYLSFSVMEEIWPIYIPNKE
jgi:hypothetical protein